MGRPASANWSVRPSMRPWRPPRGGPPGAWPRTSGASALLLGHGQEGVHARRVQTRRACTPWPPSPRRSGSRGTCCFEARPRAVLHVVDAKNIARMLGLTLQLIEAGLPVVLVLNMADEARDLGIRIDAAAPGAGLGIPVVATVATRGQGLRANLAEASQP